MPSRLSRVLTASLSPCPKLLPPLHSHDDDDGTPSRNKSLALTNKKEKHPSKPKSKRRNSLINIATFLLPTRSKPLPRSSLPPPSNTEEAFALSSLCKNASKGVVTVPPPPQLLAHLENVRSQHDRHDSTFSSASSSSSDLKPLILSCKSRVPTSSTPLTRSQITALIPLLRRLERCLARQDELCRSLSVNLLYLMAVKERIIRGNRKVAVGRRRALASELGEVREELGSVFVRKVGIEGETRGAVKAMAGRLRLGEGKEEESGGDEGPVIDVEMIEDLVNVLKRDVKTQRLLDVCVMDAITRRCWNERWIQTVGQRTEMCRFVGFVAGRVGKLGEVEEKMMKIVGVMERTTRETQR